MRIFIILSLVTLAVADIKYYTTADDNIDMDTLMKNSELPIIYVPLLGTGLLSEQEGLGHSSHAGPVRIGNFTHTIELLRRLMQVSSRCFPSPQSS
ncbi:unnamed protein product [Pieris macdunnoughi]|uniref:Uncharacterized protein n=1 Tax=Pieris macdunnoughi TaxID=345717 RepID=A0A821PR31_9NEOP|nr:unnamed protein product [Pieris macdunnoughi]